MSLRFFDRVSFDFMGMRKLAYVLSASFFALSVMVIALKRFEPGIDFAGGTLVQIGIDPSVKTAGLRSAISASGLPSGGVQSLNKPGEFIVRFKGRVAVDTFRVSLGKALGSPVRVDRVEAVGPRIGKELAGKAFWALLIGVLLMLAYIWIRFNIFFGLGSVIALVHDVVITIGVLGLMGIHFNVPIVAALLTLIGYSINDSIVVSDRVREHLKAISGKPSVERLKDIFNDSIGATLSRTVNTSLTTELVLVSVLVLGGPVIFDFAFTLAVGVVVGTYSSIWVVSSLVYDWNRTGSARRAGAPG